MVLPIGGFLPIPLALMIPFMFMQSVMMGYGFGTGFQYSKRKISAMSNEEFNATSIEKEAQKMFKAYQLIIPDLQESIVASKELQKTVLTEMINIPANLIKDLFGILAPDTQEPSGTSGSTTGTFETTQETVGGTTEVKPTADPFAIENALSDQVNKDWYSGMVYRDVWIPLSVYEPFIDRVDKERKITIYFFKAFEFDLVKTLQVFKIVDLAQGIDAKQFRIYYHL